MSSDPIVSLNDRREHNRYSQHEETVTVIAGGNAFELALVNLSQYGASGRPRAPITKGEWVQLRFKNERRVDGVVRWVRDDLCGIEFGRPLGNDISLQLIHRRQVMRPRRYRVTRQAEVTIDDIGYPALIRNVSERGLRIETNAPLTTGRSIAVMCGIAPPILADVRWSRDGQAGLHTRAPIDLDLFETQTRTASLGRVE